MAIARVDRYQADMEKGMKPKRNASKARTEAKPVELKPCPFCGESELEPVEVGMEDGFETGNWAMRCNYCGAFGPQCGMRQNTGKAWNGRSWNGLVRYAPD